MEKIKLALVDLDGTLIRGSSAERTFFWYLFGRGHIRPPNFVRFLLHLIWLSLISGLDQAKGQNKTYLKGESLEQVQKWAKEFAASVLRNLISSKLRQRILHLKKEGYMIALLSGSLQMLVDQLKDYLQADILIGVQLEVDSGRLSGWKSGIYPFGQQKIEALFQYIKPDQVDWKKSYAFADRMADLPVLNLVGHPVVVNPEKKLLRFAQKKGWEIIKEKPDKNSSDQ